MAKAKDHKTESGGHDAPAVSADGPSVVGGEGGEMTISEFIATARGVVAAVKSRDWPGTFANAGKLLNVFADVFGLGAFKVWGGGHGEATAGADLDALDSEVRECREIVGAEMANGPAVRWEGSPPVSSGAAAPMAADPKTFDPAAVMLIIELVAKLVEAIRKRRNPKA